MREAPSFHLEKVGSLLHVKIRGTIDETVVFPESDHGQLRTEIDLGDVRFINSIGIRLWISWLGKLPGELALAHAPAVFLQAAKIIAPVLPAKAELLSFQVATGCLDCGKVHAVEVANDPSGEAAKAAIHGPHAPCPDCQGETELELPAEFYARLARFAPGLPRAS